MWVRMKRIKMNGGSEPVMTGEELNIDIELLYKQRDCMLKILGDHHRMEARPRIKEGLDGLVHLCDAMLDILDEEKSRR